MNRALGWMKDFYRGEYYPTYRPGFHIGKYTMGWRTEFYQRYIAFGHSTNGKDTNPDVTGETQS